MPLAEMSESIAPSKADSKTQKAFSCLRCFERKVKCDKTHPCNNCVKSGVACHFRIPSAPKRKKKRGAEEILLERLKRAEDLLRSKGITNNPNDDSSTAPTELGPPPQQSMQAGISPTVSDIHTATSFLGKSNFTSGKLITNEGRARFIDNTLWSSLSEEFHPKDAIDEYESDDDDETLVDESNEFVLGLTPNSNIVQQLHPTPDSIFKLWQVFLENVNPMTKIIHYPSLQEQLVKASTNLENIPKNLEALFMAIYHAAVSSLDDSECETMFAEPRKTLISRYRHGTRRALARARFLGTADLAVLQAFVLYVLCIRSDTDARTVWTLAGVANRIGQSMGVHRDGQALGVPPFETEMRRRLWWQITILDFRSAELTGSGRFGDISLSDTDVPTNVDDTDIWPGMTESPVGKTKPTEMVSCLLRCEFGRFWKEKILQKTRKEGEPIGDLHTEMANNKFNASLSTASPWNAPTEERDAHIDELQKRLEEKFLRYLEPSVPIQFMCSCIGRGAIYSMRLMAHHPRRYKTDAEVPQSERELLWRVSLKLLEGDNLCSSTKSMKRFQWHTRIYFHWQALIYMLSQLKVHTTGEDVDYAWKQVDEIYENHTEFIIEWTKPLHVAVGGLALKAWDARIKGRREAQERGEFMVPLSTPDYIEMLRQHKSMPKRRADRMTSTSNFSPPPPQTTPNGTFITPPSMSSQGPSPGQPTAMAWQPTVDSAGFDFNNYNPGLQTNYYFDPGMSVANDPSMSSISNDMSMDWTQWNYLLQDFDVSASNTRYGSSGM